MVCLSSYKQVKLRAMCMFENSHLTFNFKIKVSRDVLKLKKMNVH